MLTKKLVLMEYKSIDKFKFMLLKRFEVSCLYRSREVSF